MLFKKNNFSKWINNTVFHHELHSIMYVIHTPSQSCYLMSALAPWQMQLMYCHKQRLCSMGTLVCSNSKEVLHLPPWMIRLVNRTLFCLASVSFPSFVLYEFSSMFYRKYSENSFYSCFHLLSVIICESILHKY